MDKAERDRTRQWKHEQRRQLHLSMAQAIKKNILSARRQLVGIEARILALETEAIKLENLIDDATHPRPLPEPKALKKIELEQSLEARPDYALYNTTEAATMLGISKITVRIYSRDGLLPPMLPITAQKLGFRCGDFRKAIEELPQKLMDRKLRRAEATLVTIPRRGRPKKAAL